MKRSRLNRLALCAALLLPQGVAAELALQSFEVRQTAQTVLLDLNLSVTDTHGQIATALARGEVWVEVSIRLLRFRWLWGNQTLGRLVMVRRLSYDPLQQRYRIEPLHHDEAWHSANFEAALTQLLRFEAIPVTRLDWLSEPYEDYHGDFQARLYANSVPISPALGPLRDQRLDWQSPTVSWPLP